MNSQSQIHIMTNGLVLIDAPHSALNMLGQAEGAAAENLVVVKVIQRDGKTFPYVSAQAWRYWWRNLLVAERRWELSPVDREKKIAFTQAQPWQYPDDDVFGYMRAQAEMIPVLDKEGNPEKDETGQPRLKKGKNITLTRVSPLKCSPLVSVSSQRPIRDFGVMSRQEGDPVPHEHQFYSTVLKGIFSLDLTTLGRFEKSSKTGFQNISEAGLKLAEVAGATVNESLAEMPLEVRTKRAVDTISALPYLSGGANQTLHLTDVAPKLILLTVLRGGNHLFMNVVQEDRGQARINTEALEEVLSVFKDRLLSPVFIGRRAGFLDEQGEALNNLPSNGSRNLPEIHVGELNSIVEQFCKTLPNAIEQT
ncbi:MAG: type I-B CRISPR-associated protein Cas7/Cst2/DevR [Candidatus Bipolaricaulia bacterium]